MDEVPHTIEDTVHRRPGPLSILLSALAALGFLLLMTRTPPVTQHTTKEDVHPHPIALRQHVVIFIVDTETRFEAHGAHVRSVIAQYCPLCEVRQINLHRNFSPARLQRALEHVLERRRYLAPTTTPLANLSLGTYTYDKGLHTAVRNLVNADVTLIASAGNDNSAKPFYPAAFPEVLGVCASTRHTHRKTAYSNFGVWVSLCAPGLHPVRQPLQPSRVASGTSFASPMVAGILGRLLLDAPCVSPRLGLHALKRTAEPFTELAAYLGAGRLQADAAAHYLRSLYSCQNTTDLLSRLTQRLQRFGSSVLMYMGLVLYFLVSIFAVPFLFAFITDKGQQHLTRRRQTVIRHDYLGSPTHRRERLGILKQRFEAKGRLPWRDGVELFAILDAVNLYGEACGWCERSAQDMAERIPPILHLACSRCGMELDTDAPT